VQEILFCALFVRLIHVKNQSESKKTKINTIVLLRNKTKIYLFWLYIQIGKVFAFLDVNDHF